MLRYLLMLMALSWAAHAAAQADTPAPAEIAPLQQPLEVELAAPAETTNPPTEARTLEAVAIEPGTPAAAAMSAAAETQAERAAAPPAEFPENLSVERPNLSPPAGRPGAAAGDAAPGPISAGPPEAGLPDENLPEAGPPDANLSPVNLSPTDLPSAPASTAPALDAFIDGLVEAQRREHGIPALGLSVVQRGQPDLLRGYGQDDIDGGRASDPANSLFRIGSVSKTFIWTSVLMLVDRGLLDLDADVNTYLKTVKLEPGFGAPVTLRHLMAHRAGFEDSLRLFSVADDDARSLAQLLAAHPPKRVFAPGARTSYSNWGSGLAAQIVEDVSGRPLREFLRSEVLDPLGMRQTTPVAPAQMPSGQPARLAQGYREGDGGVESAALMQLGAYWPAGGIASTPAEMARWMHFHLNGGELEGVRLLSAENHALLFTRPFNDRPGAVDLTHGLVNRPYRGLQTFGHGGATARFLTNMVLVPELGLGIFLSQNINASRNTVSSVPDQIIDRLQGAQTPVALVTAPADAGALAAANGTYLNNRRVFTSFAAVFASLDAVELAALSPERLLYRKDGQATQYARVGEDLFESVGGDRLALIRDARGGVAAFVDGSGVHSYERTGLSTTPIYLQLAFLASLLLSLTTTAGLVWRLGRVRLGGALDRLLGGFSVLAAFAVFGCAICIALLSAAMSSGDASTLVNNYPPPQMLWLHWAGWAVVGAALLMLLGLPLAWLRSHYGVFRRLHYSLFTLALIALAVQLYLWRVVGAPVY